MTFVWGFGVRKPEVPVTRAAVAGTEVTTRIVLSKFMYGFCRSFTVW